MYYHFDLCTSEIFGKCNRHGYTDLGHFILFKSLIISIYLKFLFLFTLKNKINRRPFLSQWDLKVMSVVLHVHVSDMFVQTTQGRFRKFNPNSDSCVKILWLSLSLFWSKKWVMVLMVKVHASKITIFMVNWNYTDTVPDYVHYILCVGTFMQWLCKQQKKTKRDFYQYYRRAWQLH